MGPRAPVFDSLPARPTCYLEAASCVEATADRGLCLGVSARLVGLIDSLIFSGALDLCVRHEEGVDEEEALLTSVPHNSLTNHLLGDRDPAQGPMGDDKAAWGEIKIFATTLNGNRPHLDLYLGGAPDQGGGGRAPTRLMVTCVLALCISVGVQWAEWRMWRRWGPSTVGSRPATISTS